MPKPLNKVKQFQREYFKTVSTMAITGFSLVAALAWNELIKSIIDRYISRGSSVISHLIYAILVTTIVVVVTMWLGSIAKRYDHTENH
jgi:hypothetical protein